MREKTPLRFAPILLFVARSALAQQANAPGAGEGPPAENTNEASRGELPAASTNQVPRGELPPSGSRIRDHDAPAPSPPPAFLREPLIPLSAAGAWRTGSSSERPERRESDLRSKLVAEFGFLDPMHHRVQFGRNGTEFDYVRDGGQDVLFPTWRLSIEASWKRRHALVFLYQPIDIRTQETLRSDLRVDEVRFPAGTPVDFRYGFDFYRVSYLYNLTSCREKDELAIGASLQLRNAVIDFTSADGLLRRSNRDVGPVPALKARGRWHLGEHTWLGFEVDGMYAPVKYLNGGRSDVVGAIVDLSLRGGYSVARPLDIFLNLRYLGGGAKGTSKDEAERGLTDGYSSNWLHFVTSTVGVEVKLERLFVD